MSKALKHPLALALVLVAVLATVSIALLGGATAPVYSNRDGSAHPAGRRAFALLAPRPAVKVPVGLGNAIRRSGLKIATSSSSGAPVPFTGNAKQAAAKLPTQGLNVQVDSNGVLHASSMGSSGASWELAPVGIGRGALAGSRPGALDVAASRVSESLGSGAVVSYRARTSSLEQSFTIPTRPSGGGSELSRRSTTKTARREKPPRSNT